MAFFISARASRIQYMVPLVLMPRRPENLDPDMFGQMAKHGDLRVPVCMPDDVANILLFLASDESKAITGQAIVSDFGSTL